MSPFSSTFYGVAREYKDSSEPAPPLSFKRRHATFEEAKSEACRLAEKEVARFYVLEVVSIIEGRVVTQILMDKAETKMVFYTDKA